MIRPSLESQQEWGSSGSRAGEEWGREQREMGHPEQGTSVFSTNVLMNSSLRQFLSNGLLLSEASFASMFVSHFMCMCMYM